MFFIKHENSILLRSNNINTCSIFSKFYFQISVTLSLHTYHENNHLLHHHAVERVLCVTVVPLYLSMQLCAYQLIGNYLTLALNLGRMRQVFHLILQLFLFHHHQACLHVSIPEVELFVNSFINCSVYVCVWGGDGPMGHIVHIA